jgi:hypothetical protein
MFVWLSVLCFSKLFELELLAVSVWAGGFDFQGAVVAVDALDLDLHEERDDQGDDERATEIPKRDRLLQIAL